MSEKHDLYWQSRLTKLEMRIEKLEAELAASRVTIQNRADTFTIKEFAAALNVCDVTIQRKVRSGEIKALKVGKTWRIPRSELDKIFSLV